MSNFRVLLAAGALGAAVLAPAAARADVTETLPFTITVSPAQPIPDGFVSTEFPLFFSGHGALDSVSISVTGTGTWTSAASSPSLTATFMQHPGSHGLPLLVGDPILFSVPGTISPDFGITLTDPFALAAFTGTVPAGIALSLTTPDSGDTFGTNGSLSGTIIYDYTPATGAVPEPATLTMLGVGLAGLAFGRRRRA